MCVMFTISISMGLCNWRCRGQAGRARGAAAEAGVAGGLRFNTSVLCARGGLAADVLAAVHTVRHAEAFLVGGVGRLFV